MKRILTAMVGLTLLTAACGSDDDSAEAAPTIVIDGETAASGDGTETTDGATTGNQTAGDATADDTDAGGDASGSGAAIDATDEEVALEFAQCMRDNGVPTFEDPVVNADGSIDLAPGGPGAIDADQEDLQAAFEVCGELLAGASFLPGADLDQAELEDDLLAMAQCLRDLGNDVDDPDLDGFGPGQAQSLFGPNFDPADPANADDIAVCQDEVFGPDGPPGPGQGGN